MNVTGELEERIRSELNRASAENASDTPDWILAAYLIACLDAFNAATVARTRWYAHPTMTETEGTK